jgi:hypothetical protein
MGSSQQSVLNKWMLMLQFGKLGEEWLSFLIQSVDTYTINVRQWVSFNDLLYHVIPTTNYHLLDRLYKSNGYLGFSLKKEHRDFNTLPPFCVLFTSFLNHFIHPKSNHHHHHSQFSVCTKGTFLQGLLYNMINRMRPIRKSQSRYVLRILKKPQAQ